VARDNDRSSYWCFERENVKESAIKFELFTASSHENVIQDLEGHTKITVMVDDEETTLKCRKNKPYLKPPKTRVRCSLLLPRRNLQQLFSSVTSTAEMAKNSILTDGEIASGLVLTCQAHPTSETYVDYDDV
jgi:ring-1,2-phenylacetyl-CoA epoxidase subunit PaaE